MKENILKQKTEIEKLLNRGQLCGAIKGLRYFSAGVQDWSITDSIDRLDQSYQLMLNYVTMGVEDPSRQSLYEDIKSELYVLLDRVVYNQLSKEEATLYYNNVRYNQLHPNETILRLIEEYNEILGNASLYDLIVSQKNASTSQVNIFRDKEKLEQRIFNHIWVSFPLKNDDEEILREVLKSNAYSQHFQELIISALLLGLLEFYDAKKLNLLLSAYVVENDVVSTKAFVAIIIALSKYHARINDKKILTHFDTIVESKTWDNDVKTIYLELVRTRDTERISRKMQDELIPEMLKLRPDIQEKLNDSSAIIDMSTLEENPEWEEMLHKSGITEKIQELNQLQEEGSDVYMSTFAQLKSFPFFSEISNWFLPFSLEHSVVLETLGSDVTVIGDIIKSVPHLCSSDKYSFILSMGSIPNQQRELMLSQFEQMGSMGMSLQSMTLPNQRKNIMNKYIQDLYRFFKLFRRKSEFKGPFENPINLMNIPMLSKDINDVETLMLIAEFYFKRKFYQDALETFISISEQVPPTAQIFQKIGYCYHQMGDVENALNYYEHAELLNADSVWTMRRMAMCYRTLNNPQQALKLYERIAAIDPNNLNVVLNMGHCHLELGNYREAIKNYYKVEYLDDKTTQVWRPLAWSLLLFKEFAQSKEYYDKILNESPRLEDYLNVGHLLFAQNNIQGAIEYYKKALGGDKSKIDELVNLLEKDKKHMRNIGIDTSLLPFIVDAISYSFD